MCFSNAIPPSPSIVPHTPPLPLTPSPSHCTPPRFLIKHVTHLPVSSMPSTLKLCMPEENSLSRSQALELVGVNQVNCGYTSFSNKSFTSPVDALKFFSTNWSSFRSIKVSKDSYWCKY